MLKLSLNKKVQLSLFMSTFLVFLVGFGSMYKSYKSTQAYVSGGSELTKTMDQISAIQKSFGVLIQEWKNILIRGHNPQDLRKYSKGLHEAAQDLNNRADALAERLDADDRHLTTQFKSNLSTLMEHYSKTQNEFLNEQVFEPSKADAAVRGKDRDVLNPIVEISKHLAETDKAGEDKMLLDMKENLQYSVGVSFLLFIITFALVRFVMQRSINSLARVAQDLSSAGGHVRTASQSISHSAQSLSQSISEAAASIEETTASTEEVSSMIKLNSDNAEAAKQLSASNHEQAQKGADQVQELIKAMNEISKSSEKMEEIISVIDDIAFQTNLLALNAAVEAARAGDQGRGFAVVAEAVRTLAQRSSTSAKEISDLIKDSVTKVDHGVTLAQKSGESLSVIVKSVAKTSELNTQISSASTEQASGIENINKAIQELDGAIQMNSTSAQTTAASSEELSGQADMMHTLVSMLEEVIYGSASKGATTSTKLGPGATIKPNVSKVEKEQFLPLEDSTPSSPSTLQSIKSFDSAS